MTLIAQIIPANGGRAVEKRLQKGLDKLAVAQGEKIEIIDSETGAPVRAYAVEAKGKGLLLKFAMPEGDVALELSGDIESFMALAADEAQFDEAAAQDAQADAADAAGAASDNDDGDQGGFSPVLLGILGLGALGGIAAAASGGGNDDREDEDRTPPAAPAALDLAAGDDSGDADDDNITNQTALTISGTAEAGARVELFNGETSLGTVTADGAGKFTLQVSLAEGAHSITARATDAAGNRSPASAPLNVTVDSTAPTAAIAISETELAAGETATVTITFSEPVIGFSLEDLTAGSGTLSDLASTDGGRTWTATFTPDEDVTEAGNVIALGASYADVAGNAGAAAASEAYAVDTLTFVVEPSEDGTVDFGGTATGPITITLNAEDEAIFSRAGKTADAVVASISTKTMNVPEGGELRIVIDGAASEDTFTLDAPNAAALIFSGDGGSLSDALNIVVQSATDGPDLRTLRVDASELMGVESIRFVFPEDEQDVVQLSADSDLSGFTTIEVSKGGVDLTAVDVQPGVEFIVNSTLILTLAQFEAMASLVSVTGLGKLTINLTADEVETDALAAFLASGAAKPILIGADVTVLDQNGQPVDVPAGLDAISYPGIPEISDRLDALEAQVDGLSIDDVAGLGDALSGLTAALAALETTAGAHDAQIEALEGKLSGITETVVAYVDAQIEAVQGRIDGLSVEDIAGLSGDLDALSDAIAALEASTGSQNGELAGRIEGLEGKLSGITETVVAYVDVQIEAVQGQIDGLSVEDIAGLSGDLDALSDAIAALEASSGSQNGELAERIEALEGKLSGITETVIAYVDAQIQAVQGQIDGLDVDDVAGLADALSSLGESIAALTGLTGEDGALDTRISALEEKLQGVTDSVVAYVDAQVEALKDDTHGEDGPTLDSIAGLRAAIEALLGGTGLGDPETEGTLAHQLANLQAQIDAIVENAGGDVTAPTVLDVQLASAQGADSEGRLNAGDTVTATVKFSEAVLVNGSPRLLLTIGDGEDARTVEATLTGGAGTDTLSFTYTITDADADATGIAIGANALVLGEDDGIADKGGNAAVTDFEAVADNDGFVIDNAPLELRTRGTTIFDQEGISSEFIMGLLIGPDTEQAFVRLDELDADGNYIVPEGWLFLPMSEYLPILLGADEAEFDLEWLMDRGISGGETVSFDLSEHVFLAHSFPVVVNKEALIAALHSEEGHATLETADMESIEEFLNKRTQSFDVYGRFIGSQISPDFLALIEGHDPADVRLEVTSALTVAQAAALAAAGFDMSGNVDYSIGDYYTTVQAALADPAQAAALQNAEQILSRGDELDNIVSMAAFDFFRNLRTELGGGNDIYNASRGMFYGETGEELIVGQQGADTINLTTQDESRDGIIYQSVHDGRTAHVVDMAFSTDEDDYREGSTLSVTINGHVYSYTTGDDGETPAQALQNLADSVMAKQVVGRVVVGLTFGLSADGGLAPLGMVYQDQLDGGAHTVGAGEFFISATNYLNLLAMLGDVANLDLEALLPLALTGGETFRLTGEDFLQIGSSYVDGGNAIALEGLTVLASAASYANFLRNYDLLDVYDSDAAAETVLDAIRHNDIANIRVDGETGTLTFVGGRYEEDLAITPGYGATAGDAIVNPGQAAMASITFSADDADYPDASNEGKTTEFDRELRVTIEGKTITATVVPGDADASVAALHAAIEAAMQEGATSAITAATSTIDLGELTADSPLNGYALTLTINGRAVVLENEDEVSVSNLMDAIRAVGGVQSVTLEDGKLVVTGEVRGTDAAQNSVTMSDITIHGEIFEATNVAAVGGSLSDLIADVTLDGTKLTFTGHVPDSDEDAPTFEIDNGEIDRAGVQEERIIRFGTEESDYYEGGTLKVTINGVEIEADMVAGDPYASMEALLTAIQDAIGEDSSGALGLESAQFEISPVGRPLAPEGIRLVAASEAPGAIDVSHVEQSYRGEEQTATITLEDSRTYDARIGGEDGDGRYADVYYEGGKVHATFVPRVSDGNGGLMDGEPVTISADMVADALSNFIYQGFNPSDYLGSLYSNVFQVSITVDGQTYDQTDFVDYLNQLDPAMSLVAPGDSDGAGKATFNELADWIGTLDGVANVIIAGTGITVEYEAGLHGTINSVGGASYIQEEGAIIGAVDTQFGVGRDSITNEMRGNPEATAQALADAINAETGAGKVIHTLFDTTETLTLDTPYYTGIGRTFSVDVTIDGREFDYIYGHSDMPTVATVGDLLDFLNEQFADHGVWSLNGDGNGFDLTVAVGAEVIFTDRPAVTISDAGAPLTLDPAEGELVIDEPRLPFIGHAEVGEDGTITITASEVGKDTFRVDEVTMDYKGVHQIATASYDYDGNYYDGGTLSVEIDTTPGEEGGLVRIHANMVEGDREASLRNLIDEINSHTQAGETAAQVVLPGSPGFTGNVTNEGDLDGGLYVSSWSITVGTGENAQTYSGRGEAVTTEGVTEWRTLAGESHFTDLGDFLAFISDLDGVGTATLDEDGNIVITSDEQGDDAFISVSYDIANDASDAESERLTATRSDHGSSGALNGVVSHAELDENGSVTIVSANATEHQFSITDAELSREPVRQEAEAEFSEDGDSYYEGGSIGLVVNGVRFETDMVVRPATTEISISDLSPSDYLSGHIFDFGNGSTSWPNVTINITVGEQSYDTTDFEQYLSQLTPPLVLPDQLENPATTPTFQDLANWFETLDGVAGVTFTSDGMTIAYESGVEGTIDQFVGVAFHGVDNPVSFSSHTGPEGEVDDNSGGGDRDATLQNLRDAIWEQVTVRTTVIDIDDSLTEDSVIGSWWVSEEIDVFSNHDSEATLGSFLTALEMLSGVESATLVDGRIVIVGSHDLPPSGEPPFAFSISNGNLGVPNPSQYTVGSDLYGAFASVEVTDDGGIWFTAADAVDGYGEIDITDVFMSVPGRTQITEIDFDQPDMALGLSDDDGVAAEISVSVAGQTITAEIQGNERDTVRALAQAIIEARDGTFEEETVTVETADRPAAVRIDLPEDVNGDSRLIKDGVGADTEIAFSVRFSDAQGGPVFSYTPDPTFDMTIEEFVTDLNAQFESWAITNNIPGPDQGSFAYDAETNQIVVQSSAVGGDAYAEVVSAIITNLWDHAPITVDGDDVQLSFTQPDAVMPSPGALRINVTDTDGVFFNENPNGPITIGGHSYSEAVLSTFEGEFWSHPVRYELHLAFDNGVGLPLHFDYDFGNFDTPFGSEIWEHDLNALNVNNDGEITLSDLLGHMNAQLADQLGPVGTIGLDPQTGQIVVTPANGYSVAFHGENPAIGNDLRIETYDATGSMIDRSLIVNDDDVLRLDIPESFFAGPTGGAPGSLLIDGVSFNHQILAFRNEGVWDAPATSGILEFAHENGGTESFIISNLSMELEDISAQFAGGSSALTLEHLVAFWNSLMDDQAIPGTMTIENGGLVIVPHDGWTASLGLGGMSISFDLFGASGSMNVISGTHSENGSVAGIEEGSFAPTAIGLPGGVTGGSLIPGIADGHFPEAEAAIDIRVNFLVDGNLREFSAPAEVDGNVTVADFITTLNDALGDFEIMSGSGALGSFALVEGEIVFTPSETNAALEAYQIIAFGISAFVGPQLGAGGATAGVIDLENVDDTGESDALVMHSESRAISEDDPIAMDPVEVMFIIDGEEQGGTFWPELIEKQGHSGSTVGDFLNWLNMAFEGVSAKIEDGDIVISGEGLESADIALTLPDAWRTLSSDAVGETGPTGGASGGSITLTAFAGLSGEEYLGGDHVDFDIYIGGVTGGELLSFSYEVEEGATLDDLLAYIEEHAASQTNGVSYLTATIGENGIELSVSGEGGVDSLWVSGLSLTLEQPRTNMIAQVAEVLGEVDFSGEDGIELHGNEVGPDKLNVGDISYDRVDTENSQFQQAVIEFNNSKLDNITNGSVVSLMLMGKTTTITVSTDGTPAFGELDLSGVATTARSSTILDALMTALGEDHPSTALGPIVRGYRDGEGNFTEEGSGTSTVLRITAGAYGQSALGAMTDIEATIVDTAQVEQFSVTAEQIREGTVSFVKGSADVEIHDGSDGDGDGQAGRNPSVIHYEHDGDEGHYILDDITDDEPGVTLGWDEADEFNYLDIDDDEEEGVSPGTIDQSWTNPGGATGYAGEKGATGANGVQQSHQNPDGGYAAIDDSPAENEDNGATGDEAHYGGASGSYDLDGLHTDHLDGQTPVAGEDHYDVDEVGTDIAVTGGYHDELTDSDHGEDGFHHDDIQDGFAAFTWDEVIRSTQTGANDGPDVINNFQVDHDFLGFEGAIEESTASGYVDHMFADGHIGGSYFNLDSHEFGLVLDGWSGLDSKQIMDAGQVADMLDEMFDFDSHGEDEGIDTSIFAIQADDDADTIAIWAHTQSSGGDSSVDAGELNLLAIVHTTGGSFGADNLRMMNHEWIV